MKSTEVDKNENKTRNLQRDKGKNTKMNKGNSFVCNIPVFIDYCSIYRFVVVCWGNDQILQSCTNNI